MVRCSNLGTIIGAIAPKSTENFPRSASRRERWSQAQLPVCQYFSGYWARTSHRLGHLSRVGAEDEPCVLRCSTPVRGNEPTNGTCVAGLYWLGQCDSLRPGSCSVLSATVQTGNPSVQNPDMRAFC